MTSHVASDARTGRNVLTDAEVAAYERDGFLRPEFRLPTDTLAELQDMVARLIADNPEAMDRGEPVSSMHSPDYSVFPLKANPDEWLAFAQTTQILDLVEDLVGPDIILWGTHLFHKAPKSGGRVNWHRDAANYPINPLATPNVWIAVTPSTVDNGCVKFIPGSHATRQKGRHVAKDDVDPEAMIALTLEEEFDESTAVAMELEPGQLYISDPFIIHGSDPNTSPQPRTGLSLRYFPATSVYEHDNTPDEYSGSSYTKFSGRPLFLMRGVDRSGKNDFSIGHATENGGVLTAR
jgi:ectoine hydroxylase-related dioxygenase (phytanoyl-CoA dioxygenase family)